MNTTEKFALNVLVAVGGSVLLTVRPSIAQGSGELQRLQPSTLGVPQTGNVNVSGTQLAGQFAGSGSGVRNLSAESISSGTVSSNLFSLLVSKLSANQNISGRWEFTNPGNSFTGFGGSLSFLDASNVSGGTLSIGRMSANVLQTGGSQAIGGAKSFSNPANLFSGNGAGLTNIPWTGLVTPLFAQLGTVNTWTAPNQFTNIANSFSGNGFDITGVQWINVSLTPSFFAENRDWGGINTFTSANNTFVGRGDGLSALNAANFGSGTLRDSRLSSNVARLSQVNMWTSPLAYTQGVTLNGWVSIADSSALEFPLEVKGAGVDKVRVGSTSGLDHTIGAVLQQLSFSSAQSSSTIVFGDAYPVVNERARLQSTGLLVSQKTTTQGAKIDDTNGANGSVMLGSSSGLGSWGKVGSDRLASNGFSMSRVTGGAFSAAVDLIGSANKDITLSKGDGTATLLLGASSITESGRILVNGFNGSANSVLSSVSGNGNYGAISVNDESGADVASMLYVWNGNGYYNAVVQADIKNFSVPDPRDPEYNLVYAAMEGPEAAVYERGSAQLANGVASIQLPEHFRLLASLETMTVQLTATGATRGLFATKTNGQIIVRELRGGNSNVTFDWEVKAVRKGYEDYQVVRPWDEALPSGNKANQWKARLQSIELKRDRSTKRP